MQHVVRRAPVIFVLRFQLRNVVAYAQCAHFQFPEILVRRRCVAQDRNEEYCRKRFHSRQAFDVRIIVLSCIPSSARCATMRRMNDTSRELRYALGALCERYNSMIADKDTLDFRLGSPQPYGDTLGNLDAEGTYQAESSSVSSDLRGVILEMIDVGQRIRAIEGF